MAKKRNIQLCGTLDELAAIVATSAVDLNNPNPTKFDFAVDFELDDDNSSLDEVAAFATGWYGIREIPDYFDCDSDYKVLVIGYYCGVIPPSYVAIDKETTVQRAKGLILDAIQTQFVSNAEDNVNGKLLLRD
jgi:hypothetical protein